MTNVKTLISSGFVFTLIINAISISCQSKSANSPTAELYETHCGRCHGMDGKKGSRGAEDLNQSDMKLEDRIEQIKYGEGQMPAFFKKMSEEEIKQIAEYTITQFGPKTKEP